MRPPPLPPRVSVSKYPGPVKAITAATASIPAETITGPDLSAVTSAITSAVKSAVASPVKSSETAHARQASDSNSSYNDALLFGKPATATVSTNTAYAGPVAGTKVDGASERETDFDSLYDE